MECRSQKDAPHDGSWLQVQYTSIKYVRRWIYCGFTEIELAPSVFKLLKMLRNASSFNTTISESLCNIVTLSVRFSALSMASSSKDGLLAKH